MGEYYEKGSEALQFIHSFIRSWALLEKPPIVHLLKNFSVFYATRRFITVFTRAIHLSLFWASSIYSIPPYAISLRSILILFTHLRLGLPSDLFISCFPTSILYASLVISMRAACPTSFILLKLIILNILAEEYKLCSSSLRDTSIV
jgi:hypothetical protein